MIRLFIAITLPELFLNAIEAICRGLPGVRWVKRDLIHLTLNFIGEVERERFLDLRDSLNEIAASSFELRIRGVGQFMRRDRSGVIWVGVESSEELIELQKKITNLLKLHHIKVEKRDFEPHITIARVKSVSKKEILEYMNEYSGFETEPCTVTEFALYSSLLRPDGPLHTVEAAYRLD
jgi:2'-5' RNA ligase